MSGPEPVCEASSIGGTSIKHEKEKSMAIRRVANGWVLTRSEFRYGDRAQDEVYISLESILQQVELFFSEEE